MIKYKLHIGQPIKGAYPGDRYIINRGMVGTAQTKAHPDFSDAEKLNPSCCAGSENDGAAHPVHDGADRDFKRFMDSRNSAEIAII